MGKELKSTECEHPFKSLGYDFIVRAFEGDFVNLEQGTGIVHIAPGHGADDYNLGLKNGVDIVQTVADDGKYNEHAIGFVGEHVYKVDIQIADKLKDLNKLRKTFYKISIIDNYTLEEFNINNSFFKIYYYGNPKKLRSELSKFGYLLKNDQGSWQLYLNE